jgi:hypothetical protein
MLPLRIVSVLVIAAAVLTSADIASATSLKPPPTLRCSLLTATQWVLPYAPHTKGTQYTVSAHGIACKQAEAYVRKLVATKVVHSTVKGGPSGWACTASASKTGLAYTGQCSPKGQSFNINAPGFTWSI